MRRACRSHHRRLYFVLEPTQRGQWQRAHGLRWRGVELPVPRVVPASVNSWHSRQLLSGESDTFEIGGKLTSKMRRVSCGPETLMSQPPPGTVGAMISTTSANMSHSRGMICG